MAALLMRIRGEMASGMWEAAPAEEVAPAGEAAVGSAVPTKGKAMTRIGLALARLHPVVAEAKQLGCEPGDLPDIASYPSTLLSAKSWEEQGGREEGLQWQAADRTNAKVGGSCRGPSKNGEEETKEI